MIILNMIVAPYVLCMLLKKVIVLLGPALQWHRGRPALVAYARPNRTLKDKDLQLRSRGSVEKNAHQVDTERSIDR